MGEIAEANAMRMHATTMASDPSFTYFEPDTIKAIQAVQDLRQLACWLTIQLTLDRT